MSAIASKGSRLAALAVLALLAVCAVAAPWLAPVPPLEQDLLNTFAPPRWLSADNKHLLGTDALGRDVFARLLHGARATLLLALGGAVLTAALGTLLGLLAGYHDGWVDALISRLIDIWMSFPPVLLSIVLAALLGAGLHTVIIALVVTDWTRFCTVIRAEVKALRELEYVTAAVAMGLTPWLILRRTLLPGVRPLLVTLLALEMGIAVVVEAVLAFAGLSATAVPTWGNVLQEGRAHLHQAWWLTALPAACILCTVLAFQVLAGGMARPKLNSLHR